MPEQQELDSSARAKYRGMAMALKPAVFIGKNGLTDNALKQTDLALKKEKLIKVRFSTRERDARDAIMRELAQRTGAVLCGETGNTAVYHRD
jgi:RNA-binding protein